MKELVIFDRRIGFYVSNCVFSQLEMSIGPNLDQKMFKPIFVEISNPNCSTLVEGIIYFWPQNRILHVKLCILATGNVCRSNKNDSWIFWVFDFSFFLCFRPWLKELAIFDCRFGFYMKNCVYSQLKTSVGPNFDRKISKIRKLGPNFGRRYVRATDRNKL